MDEPPGLTRYLPWVIAVGVLFTFAIAYTFALSDLAVVDRLLAAQSTPPRDVQRAPAELVGPVTLKGKLFGPEDRTTPGGRAAAAYRAWVEPTDDDSSGEFCVTTELDHLVLVTDEGPFAIGWLEGVSPALYAGDNSLGDAASSARVIEFGPDDPEQRGQFDGPLAPCRGDSRTTKTAFLPQGADVEVFTCHANGVLLPCRGSLEGVVSAQRLDVHRRRRAGAVATPFRFAGALSVMMVAAAAIFVRQHARRVFQRLRAERKT